MGGVIDAVGDVFGGGGDDPGKDIKKATKMQVEAQREALQYLKEREALPQEFREGALEALGGLYGFERITGEGTPARTGMRRTPIYKTQLVENPEYYPGAWEYGIRRLIPKQVITGYEETPYDIPGTAGKEEWEYTGTTEGQQALIDRAIQSPLYQSIMGGQEAGEEAILRNAAATGGLRSGNVQEAMYDYNTQLQNQALLASYNEQLQGLTGLAGLGSNTNQIANMISQIGGTQAQGMTAATQAGMDVSQRNVNNLLGLAGTVAMFSDRRLKRNIKKIGEICGFNFYSFDWNSIANKLGLKGSTCGCIADEVFELHPNAVFLKDNFMMVNYTAIGVL